MAQALRQQPPLQPLPRRKVRQALWYLGPAPVACRAVRQHITWELQGELRQGLSRQPQQLRVLCLPLNVGLQVVPQGDDELIQPPDTQPLHPALLRQAILTPKDHCLAI
eukprot:CAMPEP_0202346048 /NCGR_PEP_ID=MMETSP1126-20121109/5009_1 /ASSEMBLY_ACC=CAM_ASM_000457 /TAXON_ID=3047 /ORGANISM="Dunaliella tertiolecta, Strain CCMP1320" /LENGTH=108 /DNA_ID=CAMNT_0048937407 /DNA_START=1080 /DNA_END=1406 /DNA_ORIENTATION=+